MRTLSPSAMSAAFLASVSLTKTFTFQSTDFDLLLILEGDLQLLELVVSILMLQRRKTCFLHSPGISESRIRLFQPLTSAVLGSPSVSKARQEPLPLPPLWQLIFSLAPSSLQPTDFALMSKPGKVKAPCLLGKFSNRNVWFQQRKSFFDSEECKEYGRTRKKVCIERIKVVTVQEVANLLSLDTYLPISSHPERE
ncbi:hypothetical protein KC367_g154 [Hortaea werneckii]|nr:hypothetical protein KC367_g154 [Hortaea werneckii]